ncbi:MAG TPA: hypothetical protein VKV16_03435, partial [Solirubrobacteraceae bacterium]|nr:hypothetical protein [Solirubrobacteraceae bacterium]
MSEQALQVGLRPVLFNARPHDPPQKVRFIDDHWVHLRDGLASVEAIEQRLYLAIALRNVASGMAIVHGWDLAFERAAPVSPIERFR